MASLWREAEARVEAELRQRAAGAAPPADTTPVSARLQAAAATYEAAERARREAMDGDGAVDGGWGSGEARWALEDPAVAARLLMPRGGMAMDRSSALQPTSEAAADAFDLDSQELLSPAAVAATVMGQITQAAEHLRLAECDAARHASAVRRADAAHPTQMARCASAAPADTPAARPTDTPLATPAHASVGCAEGSDASNESSPPSDVPASPLDTELTAIDEEIENLQRALEVATRQVEDTAPEDV